MGYSIPQVFDVISKDGTTFKCSIAWVRKFLENNLRWVLRRTTRAAQKLPTNVDEILMQNALRLAHTCRDGVIFDAAFDVNIDQTQITLQPGTTSTYEERGSKQVAVLGAEEKRAFTLVVGLSASGDLLPYQAIYRGKTIKSLPSPSSPGYAECIALGFQFEFSSTDTYWSTFATMCTYVNNILVPYWNTQKERVGASPDQECILRLDVWSVHRSVQFRTWLDQTHPWIKYRYVPAGTTGLAQPADVGLQRPTKLSIKQSQRSDIIGETIAHLKAGNAPTDIRLDTKLGVLCNRSVNWLLAAFKATNRKDLIKMVCLNLFFFYKHRN
ncbi:hypothetical protein FIBSPDRAFT_769955 [Athelia psychrophila]|uniref:DDE-1 domain-containing protein n=1 Tax=Athelia psychrophila TaxID=1759441 RepID=A0A167TCN0_9AGAM|nr:hypothetical protein FIBSPDRAFT_769969 [Fibularhizoctonia sp. CBS 109695]KZP02803.1 hypothetical protein FIBSPDRAFT_769955 [Fibularhizoctonia sp. CBS 109695]